MNAIFGRFTNIIYEYMIFYTSQTLLTIQCQKQLKNVHQEGKQRVLAQYLDQKLGAHSPLWSSGIVLGTLAARCQWVLVCAPLWQLITSAIHNRFQIDFTSIIKGAYIERVKKITKSVNFLYVMVQDSPYHKILLPRL